MVKLRTILNNHLEWYLRGDGCGSTVALAAVVGVLWLIGRVARALDSHGGEPRTIEPWTPVETSAQGGWRFFKVGVEMR